MAIHLTTLLKWVLNKTKACSIQFCNNTKLESNRNAFRAQDS